MLQLLFGLGQRALAGGGGLAVLLGGVDVRDPEVARLAGLGVCQLPVSERAAVPGPQLGREALLALGDVAQRSEAVIADVGEEPLAKPGLGAQRNDELKLGAGDLTQRLGGARTRSPGSTRHPAPRAL